MTPEKLLSLFDDLSLEYTHHTHAPIFTVEEGREIKKTMPGCHTKNLFVKDKKKNIFLIVARSDITADLTGLSKRFGRGRFSFCNEELMGDVLGVKPGSVTPFSLINDRQEKRVSKLILCQKMMEAELLNYHPLVNTGTVAMPKPDFVKFLDHCGHDREIVDLENPL